MTSDEYLNDQRAKAEAVAPPDAIDHHEFVYRASFYELPVLRQAGIRYAGARGRNVGQVLERMAERLAGPAGRGDDFRVALGHIEATRRWMVERGLV